MIATRSTPDGIVLPILVSPGSSKSAVRGIHGNALKVAVRSPPEKGKANKEAEAVLAEFFGVGKGCVAVISGETSRNKQVLIRGIDQRSVEVKLSQLK
jgi:uncharacterized protein (TIGR00251 family)